MGLSLANLVAVSELRFEHLFCGGKMLRRSKRWLCWRPAHSVHCLPGRRGHFQWWFFSWLEHPKHAYYNAKRDPEDSGSRFVRYRLLFHWFLTTLPIVTLPSDRHGCRTRTCTRGKRGQRG